MVRRKKKPKGKRIEVLETLKGFGERVCDDIDQGKFPSIRVPSRNVRNIIYDEVERAYLLGDKTWTRTASNITHLRPLTQFTWISYFAKELLKEGRTSSLDYSEPILVKVNGIPKMVEIGRLIDQYYVYGEANIEKPVSNLEVLAFDPETLRISWRKASAVYRHRHIGYLYRLTLETGREIALTGSHSIFSYSPDTAEVFAREVSKMKAGDIVVIPKSLPPNAGGGNEEINLLSLIKKNNSDRCFVHRVPTKIFDENKDVIKKEIKKRYRYFNQMFYYFKKQRSLPLDVFNLVKISDDDLRKVKIMISKKKFPSIIPLGKEFARLLGYFVADGCYLTGIKKGKRHGNGLIYSFNTGEKCVIDVFNISKKIFDTSPRIYKKGKSTNLCIYRAAAYRLFKILGVKQYAKEKRVPEIVFNMPLSLQREFIKAWLLGDRGVTSSRYLISDILYLLLQDGVIGTFRRQEREGEIEGRTVRGVAYALRSPDPYGRKKASSRYANVPLTTNIKEKHPTLRGYRSFTQKNIGKFFMSETISEKIGKLMESDFGFVKIVKMEKVKPTNTYVYDVSVPSAENFVAGIGGIVCHNTLRDVYYSSQAYDVPFKDQSESNDAIMDIEAVMRRPREEFNIVPEERASVFGDLTIEYTVPGYEGKRVNLSYHPDGVMIGHALRTSEFVKTSAERVFVIEKGAVFTRFIEENVPQKYKAILISTVGQAPRAARYLIKRLNHELNLPIYILTDADPWGLHVSGVIIYGSANAAHILGLATPEAKWMGVWASDLIRYELPSERLTDVDLKRLRELLRDPRYRGKFWQEELKKFLEIKRKAELEAFSRYGLTFIVDRYLKEKMEASAP